MVKALKQPAECKLQYVLLKSFSLLTFPILYKQKNKNVKTYTV